VVRVLNGSRSNRARRLVIVRGRMSERESAARWCSPCEEWTLHDTHVDGNRSTREEVETVYCSRCGTVEERRKLGPLLLSSILSS